MVESYQEITKVMASLIMVRFLLDSNILILHTAGQQRLLFERKIGAVSTLTVFELLRLPGMSEKEEHTIRELISLCQTISVNNSIAERAALLSRNHPKKHPIDLLLAATALELGVPIITKNIRDFKKIPQLEILETIPHI